MRNLRDLLIGITGTFAAIDWPASAATFAGIATGLWMLRQIFMSFRHGKPRR